MSDVEARQVWYEDFPDIGYALGRVVMVYLLFKRERKKEIDILWSDYIEPYEDDRYKIRFIEDGGSYVFMMYKEPRGGEDSNFGFYRGGLDVRGLFSGFKSKLQGEVLFTYGFVDGELLRLSESYKRVKDLEILDKSEVVEGSFVWKAIESHKDG